MVDVFGLFLQILLPNELSGVIFETEGLADSVTDSLQLCLHMSRGEIFFISRLGCVLKDPGAVLNLEEHGVGIDEPTIVTHQILGLVPVKVGNVIFVIPEPGGIDLVPFVEGSSGA